MRSREHMLVITMLAKQTQLIRILFEILKSRELMQGDDVNAFEAFLLSDPALTERVLEMTKDQCRITRSHRVTRSIFAPAFPQAHIGHRR